MAVSAVQNNSKVGGGLCPHGLPPSACPICSGGMGGAMQKRADHTAKPGEMSWNECAAIGAMLRAQKLAKQRNLQAQENRIKQIVKFESQMMNISKKLALIATAVLNNTPPIISKPINFFINKLTIPSMNFIKNMPVNIMKNIEKFKQKFIDIQDKLNAMFGELKNSIEKKISETLANFKKKFRLILQVEETVDSDNEEKKIEEEKRTFEVKTFINDLYNRITKTVQSYGQYKKENMEKDASK